VKANIEACVTRKIHCVVGTTGLSDADLAEIGRLVETGKANVFVAPNFSIGAVLMMRFANQAARYFGSAEIVELHHNRKLDAPSGTSLRTAREIAEGWRTYGRPEGGRANPDEEEVIAGARGADADGVTIHSVRLHGLVAHQEVWFGGPGESLLIRHDSIDRSSFMPGVLLAVKKVVTAPGLTIGLEHFLDD
jgi:4-hydroxy-tetrahydrodipicolinate reductase